MTIVILYTSVIWLLGYITGHEVADLSEKIKNLRKKGGDDGSDADKN